MGCVGSWKIILDEINIITVIVLETLVLFETKDPL